MIRRYWISLVAILLATLVFFGERYLIRIRAVQLSRSRLDALEENFSILDRLIKAKNDSGEYFRYLGIRPDKDFDLADLNPDPRLVSTAVVLDRNFRTLARSGRDLSDTERQVLRSGQRSGVTSHGLLRTYMLTDFSGLGVAYLALAIRPTSSEASAALYAASLDLSNVVSLDPEVFGKEDNLLLAALLSRQGSDNEIINLHGVNYLSVRRFLIHQNLAFFQLSALPPAYAFFSFYLLLTVVLSAAIWLLQGAWQNRYSRREVSERILHSYGRAIDAHASALGELSRLAGADNIEAEKLVIGDVRHADIEERIQAERESQQQKEYRPKPIVIDIMPEERQFRFMNPARQVLPTAAEVRLGAKEQKLRERAFSDELKTLMVSLDKPAGAAQVPQAGAEEIIESIRQFEQAYHFPAIDQYLYYLNELYFDEVTAEELSQAMRVAGDVAQSHEFAILVYDGFAAAFRCRFVQGVPAELLQTLYLLPKDSIIPNDFTDYGYVEVTDQVRKSPFFQKRFPRGLTENLKGIHVFPVAESFLRARILFFDSARGGPLKDLGMIATVRSYLRQVAPALHMFFMENSRAETTPQDLAEWSVRELRETISLVASDQPILISQYVFEDSLPAERQFNLVRELAKMLAEGEKVLVMSPSRVIVAHGLGSSKSIEALLSAEGKKFIIKESEFGRNSRNLYTFTEF